MKEGRSDKSNEIRARSAELIERWQAGDYSARDELLCLHQGLVHSRVRQFLAYCNCAAEYMKDDLISGGMVGLVRAVNDIRGKEVENPTAYFGAAIQNSFCKVLEDENAIRIPSRTLRRKAAKGTPLHLPKKQGSAHEFQLDAINFLDDPDAIRNIREAITAACECDIDLEIVRLREEGYVDREISERLGIPLTTIYIMRRMIYARFLELMEWKV